MRFGLFYELQLPRPWRPDSELRIVHDTLTQIELADRLGFDYAWAVEHHFLEEYSHCSAPEVLLGAASQRTERIRLGHGIMVLPPGINAPARVAERIGMLDLLCNGRAEFGTGESSTEVELGAFGIEMSAKRAQWRESIDAVTRMFVEEPFAGYDGTYVQMPPRNIVPKPLQKPHPPMWTACSKRESLTHAARHGLGALTFSFVAPDEAEKWIGDYYATIESEECVPAGYSVNPQVAMTLYLMCDEDEATARERGLADHRFFARSLAYYWGLGSHVPGKGDLARDLGLDTPRDQVDKEFPAVLEGAYSGIGTPEQIRRTLREYEAAGVDQILLIAQSGRIKHEHICSSMELFAREVMPEFAERHESAELAKAKRLAPAIEAALARRTAAREVDPEYRVPRTAMPTALPRSAVQKG
ncbi:LLM class flavin-dependent oxidoreductase [Micromonospora sp. NPDC006431]|uniref:LLM class flavin-dependent oxidoreductase n=1 Tax=Micromonospora sp. NPDC006431 TaxID=3364235 RepID=UPI0036953B4A